MVIVLAVWIALGVVTFAGIMLHLFNNPGGDL